MLVMGKRLDTVSLDFAKAFDKVDHEILLEKVKITHKISEKNGKWIRKLLTDRKFSQKRETYCQDYHRVQF